MTLLVSCFYGMDTHSTASNPTAALISQEGKAKQHMSWGCSGNTWKATTSATGKRSKLPAHHVGYWDPHTLACTSDSSMLSSHQIKIINQFQATNALGCRQLTGLMTHHSVTGTEISPSLRQDRVHPTEMLGRSNLNCGKFLHFLFS